MLKRFKRITTGNCLNMAYTIIQPKLFKPFKFQTKVLKRLNLNGVWSDPGAG